MSIISLVGKQFVVNEGDKIAVFSVGRNPGDEIVAKDVLGGADVKLRVIENKKGPKTKVLKFIKSRGYRRTYGSRESLSLLEVIGEKSKSGQVGESSKTKTAKVESKPKTKPVKK